VVGIPNIILDNSVIWYICDQSERNCRVVAYRCFAFLTSSHILFCYLLFVLCHFLRIRFIRRRMALHAAVRLRQDSVDATVCDMDSA